MRKTLICTAALAVFSFPALAAPPPPPPPCQPGMAAQCPAYTAPATTAVPGQPVDGGVTVQAGVSTLLFGGIRPPNGFMVQNGTPYGCWVTDNGAANSSNGFLITSTPGYPSTFITPPGYKPMGPVSVECSQPLYVAARAW
jgi:hypothetical protein